MQVLQMVVIKLLKLNLYHILHIEMKEEQFLTHIPVDRCCRVLSVGKTT